MGVNILRKGLAGPIVPGVNPVEHSVDTILKSYFREIMFLARKFTRTTVDFEDLVVEGLIGLLDACKRYDPTRSDSFHNLAIVRIKSQMYEYYLSNNSTYSVPNYMARLLSLTEQIKTLIDNVDYSGDSEKELRSLEESTEFIAAAPPEILSRVRYLKERIRKIASNSKASYDEMLTTVLKVRSDVDTSPAQEDLGVDSPEEEIARREFLEKFLTNLTPDARDVLMYRLEGETLTSVGEKKGVTRERIRQIQEAALEHLHGTKMFRQATDK